MGIPIDRGAVPSIVAVLTVLSVLVQTGRHWDRWARWAGAFTASLAAVVASGHLVGIEQRVGSSFPPSFYVWAALPLTAAVFSFTAPLRPGGPRLMATASVVLCALLGVVEVNAHYAYLPTVGDVLGRPMHDEVRGNAARVAPRLAPDVARPVLLRTTIPATVSGFHARPGYVWLPAAWFRRPRPVLPLVVMIAGVPGDPSNLLRGGGAARVADAYASEHDGVAPILVFPDQNGGLVNDTECVDGPRGRAETYLTVDLPAWAQAHFTDHLAPRPWAILGYSEGGTCALTLSLRHPGIYGSFVDIGGEAQPTAGAPGRGARERTIRELYGGQASQWSAHDPWHLLESHPPVSGLFVDGTLDHGPAADARRLVVQARRSGVDVRLVTVPGGHSFAMVRRAISAVFPATATSLLGARRGLPRACACHDVLPWTAPARIPSSPT